MPDRPQREARALSTLRAYPTQAGMFDPLSDADLEALARDIRERGLKHSIEVLPANAAGLPAGTVVCGHQRLRALQLNGETEVVVLVRHDMAGATRAQIEAEFLTDNLLRRQMDPLAKARVALRRAEVEREINGTDGGPEKEGEVRDRVGRAIGMSGRNLVRYLSILRAPVEVQTAFQAGRLKLVPAARVGGLDKKAQTAISRRLRKGEDAAEVVKDYLAAPEAKSIAAPDQVVRAFAVGLEKLLAALAPALAEVGPADVEPHLARLKQARLRIGNLTKLVEDR